MLCMLECLGAEVGSWFGTEDMGYMAGVVAVHMVQVEVVAGGDRMAWSQAEGHMTSHFAGRKLVVRDERECGWMVAGWRRSYAAGLDNHFARCSVDHLVGPGKLDSAADHSCPAVAYNGAHDVRQAAQRRMHYPGYRHFGLTSCCVRITVVKGWNVKSSDHTERTLKSSDHIARPPWYLHHLEHTLEVSAVGAFHIARLKNRLDGNHTVIVVLAFELHLRGIRIDLSSVFLAVYR